MVGSASKDVVTYSVVKRVATVTLNRPQVRNALNAAMLTRLLEVTAQIAADDSVRVAILAGNGPAFCSGADVSDSGGPDTSTGLATSQLAAVLSAWERLDKPTVARVHGPAIGGGVGLVAVCDIAIAAADATFAFREVRVGVAPAVIAVPLLQRINASVLRELMLSGRSFDGQGAHDLQLVHHVVAPNLLSKRMTDVIEDLLAGGPQAQAATKQLLRQLPQLASAEAYELAAKVSGERFASHEAQNGMAAFRSKQTPNW